MANHCHFGFLAFAIVITLMHGKSIFEQDDVDDAGKYPNSLV